MTLPSTSHLTHLYHLDLPNCHLPSQDISRIPDPLWIRPAERDPTRPILLPTLLFSKHRLPPV